MQISKLSEAGVESWLKRRVDLCAVELANLWIDHRLLGFFDLDEILLVVANSWLQLDGDFDGLGRLNVILQMRLLAVFLK